MPLPSFPVPSFRARLLALPLLLTTTCLLTGLFANQSVGLAAPAKASKPAKPAAIKPVAKSSPVPTSVPSVAPGLVPRRVYDSQCSYCHSPKPASALPDLKAWVRLLYTSGCPEVTVKLDESQRRALKALMEAEFKPRPQAKL